MTRGSLANGRAVEGAHHPPMSHMSGRRPSSVGSSEFPHPPKLRHPWIPSIHFTPRFLMAFPKKRPRNPGGVPFDSTLPAMAGFSCCHADRPAWPGELGYIRVGGELIFGARGGGGGARTKPRNSAPLPRIYFWHVLRRSNENTKDERKPVRRLSTLLYSAYTLHRALHDGRPVFPGSDGRLPIWPRCGRV